MIADPTPPVTSRRWWFFKSATSPKCQCCPGEAATYNFREPVDEAAARAVFTGERHHEPTGPVVTAESIGDRGANAR